MYKRSHPPPNRGKKSKATPDLGMFGLPDLSSMIGGEENDDDDDIGDDDLEAELHRLLSGQELPKKQSKHPLKPAALKLEDIRKMAGLESDSDDETAEGVEKMLKDPELLAELASLEVEGEPNKPQVAKRPAPPVPMARSAAPAAAPSQTPSLSDSIRERLANYQQAEKSAKELGDSSKARRFSRAIKTLESQLRAAQAGRAVPEDEIPPPVAIPKPKSAPPTVAPPEVNLSSTPPETAQPPKTLEDPPKIPPRKFQPEKEEVPTPAVPPRPAPSPPPPPVPQRVESAASQPSTSRAQTVPQSASATVLEERREQYRHAALSAKNMGESAKALAFMKTAKQFDAVLAALKNHQPIDLSNMPAPPPATYLRAAPPPHPPPLATQPSPQPIESSSSIAETPELDISDLNEPEDPTLYKAPPPPSTVLGALEQRLEKYRSTVAESSDNASKVRRLNRIVKQYEEAIRLQKAGRPVDYESLPCPPGFGPIPMPSPSASQSSPSASDIPAAPPKPAVAPQPPTNQPQRPAPAQPAKPPLQRNTSRTSTGGHSIQEKQLSYLLERQAMFKQAALDSKRKGDLELAKEYLRKSKGMEPMITASRSGLPIDASTIPTPPQIQEQYVVVEASDCTENNSEEMFRQLERELTHQIEICERNKQHFLKLGDVSSASKFEKLALNTAKDLNVVLNLWKRGDTLPRFHYETRDLSIVMSHPDLSSSELEVKVIRGIDLPGKPDELDTFVRVELPLPSSDNPQKAKSSTVYDTTNPEYNQAFKFEINRTRSLIRIFKRCNIKCEVLSKGGFFKGDSLLGTAQVKLVDLEKACSIHDSYELLQNRRPTGGKLEIQVRIREPLMGKQVEEIKERWLVIG